MVGKDGGPAFPAKEEWNDRGVAAFNHYTGMSLRDYFAAQAMKSLIVVQPEEDHYDEETNTHVAERAYHIADAMIRARDNT